MQSWGGTVAKPDGCCWLVALLEQPCSPHCTCCLVADNRLAYICTCQVQERGQLEAGNNSVWESSDSEPEPEAGPFDTEPEDGRFAHLLMNEAGHMFYSVKTRHFIAFLVHAVCGTPRIAAVPGGLPGHHTSGDKLLRQVPQPAWSAAATACSPEVLSVTWAVTWSGQM